MNDTIRSQNAACHALQPSLLQRVAIAIQNSMEEGAEEYELVAQAALDACQAEDLAEALRWYASDEAYGTEGIPGDTVYDRMHRRERVLIDRGQRAWAVLAKLDGKP